MPSDLPTGTLTFLYTDVEGSTHLWEQHPEAVEAAMSRHDRILREAVAANGGRVFRTVGDGLCAVFANASNAVAAALDAQRALHTETWGEIGPVRVRMALHTGEAEVRDGDYFGSSLNRIGRLLAVTHGGQALLSQAAQLLARGSLPAGAGLLDLGEIRLRDLTHPERVFQLLHPDLPAEFPPLASLDNRPNNLPTQPTMLIGRETELAEIMKLLKADSVRLLTLTGPGGTGKTRLALQAAADLIDGFEDGVYFVDLVPIRDPEAVLAAIARTVGIRETSDRPLLEELKAGLRTKEMLLLLDNFEQVTAAAPRVVELLRDCPQLKLLVTSREALHVRDEHLFPVPPLALPKAGGKQPTLEQLTQYEAVRLFIERAQAVKPGFQVTNENAPAVAEICTRLDGLPLAIELAASRIGLFSPQALLDRLGSRLRLLRGGARDLPIRQQTLRDTIAWSYELLDPGSQRLFELLSAFPGGCSFEAVEAVAGGIERLDETGVDVLDGLASLVDKSLIRQAEQDSGDPRFVMLETIREYATERLEQDPELSASAYRAHAAYFAEFTKRQWEYLTGDRREAALGELEADLENVRSAWRYWTAERDLEQLGKFIDSLWLLYDARGWYHAAVDLTNDLLNVLSSTPSTPERLEQEIMLRTSLAWLLLVTKGYTTEVEEAYTRALDLLQGAGEVPLLFPVLRGLSLYYVYRGEFEKAVRIGEQMLNLSERLDDGSIRVTGHLVLGSSLAFINKMGDGLAHLEEGIALYDSYRRPSRRFRLGSDPGVACMTTSALTLWVLGFPDRASARSKDALALARRLNHPFSMAYAQFHTGLLHLWRREMDLTHEHAQAVLDVAEEHELQIWKAVASCLQGAAVAGMGRAEDGLLQIQQGMDIYRDLKTPPVFWSFLLFIRAWACGQAGRPEDGLVLIDEAMEAEVKGSGSAFLVEFSRLKGDLLLMVSPDKSAEAESYMQKALDISQDLQAWMPGLRTSISLSRLWRAQGKTDQARRVLSDAYGRMTEGFTTADLKEAKALLEELS